MDFGEFSCNHLCNVFVGCSAPFHFFFSLLTAHHTSLTAAQSLLSVLFFNLPKNTSIQFSLPSTSLYPVWTTKRPKTCAYPLMMGEGPDPHLDISLDPPSPSHTPQLPSTIPNNYLKGKPGLPSLFYFNLGGNS